ncbi:MAG: alpha/beta hydrolase [Oceanicoccus sp.]
MNKYIAHLSLLIALLILSACSSNKRISIDLMAAPEIYHEKMISPFNNTGPIDINDPFYIFYATDRQPAEDIQHRPYYLPERSHVLRLGRAKVKLGGGEYTWEETRDITLLKERSKKYPLSLRMVEEFGVLDSTIGAAKRLSLGAEVSAKPGMAYAAAINRRLASSSVKDIYIYTHGYKVHFDNPVLVSAELHHFLGYQGVFIAYSWPATPSIWAYSSDLETTRYTANDFRGFLQYLAENTDAERIHIIGYSAGTRVVIDAIWQLALLNQGESKDALSEKFRIGQVLLMASDYDRDSFVNTVSDRVLDIPDHTTIYLSETDKALGMSSWLLNRRRLGEIDRKEGGLTQEQINTLAPNHNLSLINVSQAERANSGKGHNYFRQSPWVSSDVLMTLRFALMPEERGLIQEEGMGIWSYPPDYIQRLRESLYKKHANGDLQTMPKVPDEKGG